MFKKTAFLLGLSMIALAQTQPILDFQPVQQTGLVQQPDVILPMEPINELPTLGQPQQWEAPRRVGQLEQRDVPLRIGQVGSVGGYTQIPLQQMNELLQSSEFKNILDLADQFWTEKFNEGLGTVVGIERQVVSGFNYKITFKPEHMRADHLAVVVVYVQPWTNTMEVTSGEVVQRRDPNLRSNLLRN